MKTTTEYQIQWVGPVTGNWIKHDAVNDLEEAKAVRAVCAKLHPDSPTRIFKVVTTYEAEVIELTPADSADGLSELGRKEVARRMDEARALKEMTGIDLSCCRLSVPSMDDLEEASMYDPGSAKGYDPSPGAADGYKPGNK